MRSLVGSVLYTLFLVGAAAVAVMNAIGTYYDAAQLQKEAFLGFTLSEVLWMIVVVSVFIVALQVWNRQRIFERDKPQFSVSDTRDGMGTIRIRVKNDSPKKVNVTGRVEVVGQTEAAIVVWEENDRMDIDLRPTEHGTIAAVKSNVIKRDEVEWHDLRLHSAKEGMTHWFLAVAHDVDGPTSDAELVLTLTPDAPSPKPHEWRFRLIDDHVFTWGYTLEPIMDPPPRWKVWVAKTARSVLCIALASRIRVRSEDQSDAT